MFNLGTGKLDAWLPNFAEANIAKWHPKIGQPSRFVAGCMEGTIYFGNSANKQVIKAKEDEIDAICDLAWNPGEDILIVVHASGKMRLYTKDATTPSIKFEKQTNLITSVGWVDALSGDFITSSLSVGALRLWNAG